MYFLTCFNFYLKNVFIYLLYINIYKHFKAATLIIYLIII